MDSNHWSRSHAAAGGGGTGAAIGAESGGALGAITGAVTPRATTATPILIELGDRPHRRIIGQRGR
jgi:hypothetical protein